MEQRYSMVTLGVADVAASKRFYEALGWTAAKADGDAVCFFQMGTVLLGLYGRQALADDAGIDDAGIDDAGIDDAGVANDASGFSGVAIAWNGRSEAEVDAALAVAVKAGATIAKPAQKVFWGGYSGYFRDPDGHLWEVAFNPFWSVDAAGAVTIPDAAE